MGIKVKIYGRDFSPVNYTFYENESDIKNGVWIDFSDAPGFQDLQYDPLALVSLKQGLAERLCKEFLIDIENAETEKYKCFVERDREKERGKDDKDLHFVERKNSKGPDVLRFNNIVGVIQEKDLDGKKLSEKHDLIQIAPSEEDSSEEDTEETRGVIASSSNEKNEQADDASDEAFWNWAFSQSYDITLQIGSRFDGNNTFFLPTMLMHKDDYEYSELSAPLNEDDMFEFLLLFLYKNQLMDAYANGPYKAYTRFENNDSRLKGAIDIARHIKLNAGMNNGKIAYSFREHTADNPYNHLFLIAHKYACKRFPSLAQNLFVKDIDFSKKITELKYMAPSYDNADVNRTIGKCRNVIAHPYHYRYERLRKTSLLLLRHMGLSMFDATDEDVQGILFYIPDLWEKFLEDRFNNSGIISDSQRTLYIGISDGGKRKETYPDFVMKSKNAEDIIVWDAKYKMGWGESYISKNIKELPDFRQCQGYMNSLGIHAMGTIFPVKESPITNERENEPLEFYPGEANQRDKFYALPIVVPSTDDIGEYMEWSKLFESNVEQAMYHIEEIVKEESDKQKALDESLKKFEKMLEKMNEIKDKGIILDGDVITSEDFERIYIAVKEKPYDKSK